jgi:hypothetical protein
MFESIKDVFISMGYRQIVDSENQIGYAKPVGYSLFVYKEDDKVLYQYFLGANKKIELMSSWSIDTKNSPEDILSIIKDAENYTHYPHTQIGSNFEFMRLEDLL